MTNAQKRNALKKLAHLQRLISSEHRFCPKADRPGARLLLTAVDLMIERLENVAPADSEAGPQTAGVGGDV